MERLLNLSTLSLSEELLRSRTRARSGSVSRESKADLLAWQGNERDFKIGDAYDIVVS
jgi:hypothetical protein